MKYIKPLKLNENKLKFYTNKVLIWFFNTFFSKIINKKMKMEDPELYYAVNRLVDKRIDFPNMVITENVKLYDAVIKLYNLLYPKNNLMDDCQYLLQHFQKELWKNKNNTNVYADAIHSMDKFINYLKSHEVSNKTSSV
jgi:hypothetical protein